MAEARDRLLDLDALIQRGVVKIKGKRYEVRNPEEISVRDDKMLALHGERLAAIQRKKQTTIADARALQDTLKLIVRAILIAPPAVQNRLNDAQRSQIIAFFTRLQRQRMAPAAEANGAPSPQTGASSSPA